MRSSTPDASNWNVDAQEFVPSEKGFHVAGDAIGVPSQSDQQSYNYWGSQQKGLAGNGGGPRPDLSDGMAGRHYPYKGGLAFGKGPMQHAHGFWRPDVGFMHQNQMYPKHMMAPILMDKNTEEKKGYVVIWNLCPERYKEKEALKADLHDVDFAPECIEHLCGVKGAFGLVFKHEYNAIAASLAFDGVEPEAYLLQQGEEAIRAAIWEEGKVMMNNKIPEDVAYAMSDVMLATKASIQ